MSCPVQFGKKNQFAIEFTELAANRRMAKVVIWLSGEPVASCEVYLPTFAAELNGVAIAHGDESHHQSDTTGIADDDLYNLLHRLTDNEGEERGFTTNNVWDYHMIHDLDDAIDHLRIYVVNEGNTKRILWKAKSEQFSPKHHVDRVWSTRVHRQEFLTTISSFIEFVRLVDLDQLDAGDGFVTT